jgi:hypothetical protein
MICAEVRKPENRYEAGATLLGSERPFGQVHLLWKIFGLEGEEDEGVHSTTNDGNSSHEDEEEEEEEDGTDGEDEGADEDEDDKNISFWKSLK